MTSPYLTLQDLLDHETFLSRRPELLDQHVSLGQQRRIFLTPEISVFFETRTSLLWTIQEMLRVEKGGHTQALEELETYNGILPLDGHVTATVLFGFLDPKVRSERLKALRHVETNFYLRINGEGPVIQGTPLLPLAQSWCFEKTSSVHFIGFSCSPRSTSVQTMAFGCSHEALLIQSLLPAKLTQQLASELHL